MEILQVKNGCYGEYILSFSAFVAFGWIAKRNDLMTGIGGIRDNPDTKNLTNRVAACIFLSFDIFWIVIRICLSYSKLHCN